MENAYKYIETLVFYDTHQLALIEDRVDTLYLCILGSGDGESTYCCVPISRQRRADLLNGRIDVREVLLHGESEEWLEVATDDISGGSGVIRKKLGEIPGRYLPDEGLILVPPSDDAMVQVARERKNLVAELSVDPPEAIRNVISAKTLSVLLNGFQGLVRRAAESIRKNSNLPRSVGGESSQLNVLTMAPGSFKVRFEANKTLDLVGDSELERAIGLIEDTMNSASDPESLAGLMESHKGHYVSNLIRVLQLADSNRSYLKLSWARPEFDTARTALIAAPSMYLAVQKLLSKEEMQVERITIEGRLKKVDIDAGSWRVRNDKDGRDFAGTLAEGASASLKGLLIDQTYAVECIEKAEEQHLTDKETVKLFAVSFRRIADYAPPALPAKGDGPAS